jgi:chaperonin GroES
MSDTIVVVAVAAAMASAVILLQLTWDDWRRPKRVLASSLSYQPRGDRIIVRRHERSAPEGGIMLPDSQQRPLNAGTVIAIGPGARNSVTGRIDRIEDLAPGDTVEFLDYAGSTVEIDGEEYLCMRDCEIHGKRP